MSFCAVIPTYNNARTVADIVRRTLAVCPKVIVVNDGSTDDTLAVLKLGLEAARRAGYDYAVTLDSDGQHCPEEIPLLTAAADGQQPVANSPQPILVVGSRNLQADGMPAGNTFANRFSNFWFRLQTGIRLPDTQTGFRLYPLHHLPCLALLTARYESELELLVFSAWRGVKLVPVGISVSYPDDRVTHVRPFWDFLRISLLNSLLCLLAIVYGYPRMCLSKLKGKN